MSTVESNIRLLSNNIELLPCRGLTIDFYKGCQYSCKYCYGHHYNNNFKRIIPVSHNEVVNNLDNIMRNESLRALIDQGIPLTCGHNTDNFQPAEKKYKLMYCFMKSLVENKIAAVFLTKSDMISDAKYIELLKEMNEYKGALVGITLITLRNDLSKALEPNAPFPERRIKTIEKLKFYHIPVFLNIRPIIPSINEDEIISILKIGESIGVDGYKVDFLEWPDPSPTNYDVIDEIAKATNNVSRELLSNLEGKLIKNGKQFSGPYRAKFMNELKSIVSFGDKRFLYANQFKQKKKKPLTCKECPSGKLNMYLMNKTK